MQASKRIQRKQKQRKSLAINKCSELDSVVLVIVAPDGSNVSGLGKKPPTACCDIVCILRTLGLGIF